MRAVAGSRRRKSSVKSKRSKTRRSTKSKSRKARRGGADRVTFTMKVDPNPKYGPIGEQQIIKWYEPNFDSLDIGTDPKMEYDRKKEEFIVSFIPGPDFPTDPKKQQFELEMLADPDDDGNYPIKDDKGESHLVSGHLTSINGKKVEE